VAAAANGRDRPSQTTIIGARDALLSTMLMPPKSLENRDALSRKTMNDQRTSAYICAVSVPSETNKEQIAAIAVIAVRGKQIKQASAELLWICCGVKPPPLPDKRVVVDHSVEPKDLHLRRLNSAAPATRQRP
jgi:hypothetical protein